MLQFNLAHRFRSTFTEHCAAYGRLCSAQQEMGAVGSCGTVSLCCETQNRTGNTRLKNGQGSETVVTYTLKLIQHHLGYFAHQKKFEN